MKFLAVLVPLLMMLSLVASDYDDEYIPAKCRHCYQEVEANVCSTDQGTFYNLCALICANAEYHHNGECGSVDLIDLEKNEK